MRLLPLSVLGLVLASSVAGNAAAQDAGDPEPPVEELSEEERTALARDQFTQGVSFAQREQWQEASDRFGRALELRQTPQIRYNLAESLFHLGKLVQASEHVAILESDEDLPPEVSRSLGSLRDRIEERVGRLTIRVEGQRADTRVTLDGRDVSPALLDVQQPVDPGRHVVRLWHGEREVASEEVLVAAGGSASLELAVPAPSARDAALAGSEQGGPLEGDGPAEDSSGGIGPWWLWTAIAVVLVGGGVAGYLLLRDDEDPTQGDFMPGVLEVP